MFGNSGTYLVDSDRLDDILARHFPYVKFDVKLAEILLNDMLRMDSQIK
jgi:hypothetical protein